jgi:flagellar motility protein MotE (MotC chaperone)
MRKLFAKIRILPVTIFAVCLMLTVKVGGIFGGLEQPAKSVSISPAAAQQAPPAAAPAAPVAPPPDRATQTGQPEAVPPSSAESPDRSALNDPTLFTQAEIDLLQQLAERREELENRAEELDQREAMLRAAEQRIDMKIQEMRGLEGTIQNLIKTQGGQEEARIASLVKIYENMKPKDAAPIFEQLDIDTLLMVAERMKERRLAPIMAEMNPQKAKDMTVELSRLRRIPIPPGQDGG